MTDFALIETSSGSLFIANPNDIGNEVKSLQVIGYTVTNISICPFGSCIEVQHTVSTHSSVKVRELDLEEFQN